MERHKDRRATAGEALVQSCLGRISRKGAFSRCTYPPRHDRVFTAVQRVQAVRADEALGARLARDARRTALRVNVDDLPGRTRALLGGAVYEAAAVTAPLAA
jgi:hypothetical protein